MKVLIIPGYQSSLEGHWQDWLLGEIEGSEMVYQDSWDYPERNAWVSRMVEVINSYNDPVLLVAHSMGSVTVAAMVEDALTPENVVGAIIVAPADAESDYLPDDIKGYAPMPTSKFPFPGIFIGSENDPYMHIERARHFAKSWGLEFINLGSKGHINTAAGFGEWPGIVQIINELSTKLNRDS